MSCLNNIPYGTGEPQEPTPVVEPAELVAPSNNISQSTREEVMNLFPVDYRTVSEDLARIPSFYKSRIDRYRKITQDTIDRFFQNAGFFTKAFNEKEVPIAIIALSIVESNVKNTATSQVGAAGVWQFMPATAKEQGLVINGSVDERRDTFKATYAAAKLLKGYYKINKVRPNWLLTISSYNYGPGNVQKYYNSNKTTWEIIESFGSEEARNYVAAWVSTCMQLGLISGINFI